MLDISPVTLEGKLVRLEPLRPDHADAIYEAGKYEDIWKYMFVQLSKPEDVPPYIAKALANQEAGSELPFAIIEKESGRVIGSTRYMNISRSDKKLEIGSTWLTPAVWKTPVNTECKWLLLRHAFEQLGCIRVQIKTDSRNLNSQRAIERIGAIKEGVLRNESILPSGYVRDAVYYSILDREWDAVNAKLQAFLAK